MHDWFLVSFSLLHWIIIYMYIYPLLRMIWLGDGFEGKLAFAFAFAFDVLRRQVVSQHVKSFPVLRPGGRHAGIHKLLPNYTSCLSQCACKIRPRKLISSPTFTNWVKPQLHGSLNKGKSKLYYYINGLIPMSLQMSSVWLMLKVEMQGFFL
ncbi:hypothetical protein MLD38_005885 [Melastoma candidum]|uniref:Uncharacterized protein n=1 Tax=Melastoma candidum TaxID=119954 RepID=A0ACB9RQ98_9MYRT|nr:hypothetical protein MLD38_005885 [Melastoma candidum]